MAEQQLPKLAGTVASELGRQIDDPQLRAALASMALYTGVPAERTPAAQMVGIAAIVCDRIHIAVRLVRKPRDFRDDMHLYKGAIYGPSPTADLRSQFPLRSGVGRLYQAGQTVFPGYGVGPALMSGIHASDVLLRDIAHG